MARSFVKQMASDGFLPVIALEAFVEGGRTYQAYKRGGFDEARERITEEFSGAVFWLGGVTGLNWLFEKIGQKILKLPNIDISIASDDVRKPLTNYLDAETTKNGAKILEKTMAKFKFAKVISSVLLANAFIGFALPKINQSITRSYHKKAQQEQVEHNLNLIQEEQNKPQTLNPFLAKPTMDSLTNNNDNNENKKDIPFGVNLLSIANKFESDRNYKLLSVDVGTASGRAYSARNNDERVEILFRDLASVYFYMFNMNNMNNWLNKLEQNGNGTRLDPVSAEHATKYMQNYVEEYTKDFPENQPKAIKVDDFRRDMFGTNRPMPDSLKGKFAGEKIKIISLDQFKQELKALVPAEELANFEAVADDMAKLQPKIKGMSILTQAQAQDVLNGGYINNPTFLREFFKNRFGKNFMDKYKFVAQNDLNAHKKELTDYVKSVIEMAQKKNAGEITNDLLRRASNHNLKMNAINWGSGFVISAMFLSTIIPKLQYLITKLRTGSDAFPGTKEYQEQQQSKNVA